MQDQEKFGKEISFGKIIRLLLMQSKLIIGFSLLGFILGIVSYVTTDKTYKVKSMMQIYQPDTRSFSDNIFDNFLNSSSTSDVRFVQDLFIARANILPIIEEYNLNVDVADLSEEEAIIFNEFDFQSNSRQSFNFKIKLDEKSYFFSDSSTNDTFIELFYGSQYELDNLILNVSSDSFVESGKEVDVVYRTVEAAFNSVRNRFSVESSLPNRSYLPVNSGLLEISFLTEDIDQGLNILNFANSYFISKTIEQESQQARQALNFVDQRLENAVIELQRNKNQLKDFRENNKSINVELEIETIIYNLKEIESQINALDVEIAKASNLFTEDNPIYLDLINQKRTLNIQKTEVEQEIVELPLAQQQYIDLYREYEVNEEIYSQLLNKKLEYSIKEASTLGNLRIVDNAYYETMVSPTFTVIPIFFVLFAITIVMFAIFRGLYFLPLSNPAEIADDGLDYPIYGVIPKEDSPQDIGEISEDSRLNQSLESLIVNLNSQFLSKKQDSGCRKITLTSGTPENGKSFISRQLAYKLSKLGNKVLLIDNDLKRGDQHKDLNKSKISIEKFSSLSSSNIDDLLVDDKFYLLPKITGLDSSFQFLYSPVYEKQMSLFEEIFDYIIIDTPPLLAVSDSAILLSMSDIILIVARHGLTKINELRQMISLSSQLGINIDGLVYNAYEKPNSYYGYYGLYGNYEYQYYAKKYLYQSYEYDKKK